MYERKIIQQVNPALFLKKNENILCLLFMRLIIKIFQNKILFMISEYSQEHTTGKFSNLCWNKEERGLYQATLHSKECSVLKIHFLFSF
jgi:hypothetical protein